MRSSVFSTYKRYNFETHFVDIYINIFIKRNMIYSTIV